MKLNNKFLIIFIFTFISFISQINYGICSDNATVVPQTAQSAQPATVQQETTGTTTQQQVQQPPVAPQPNTQTGAAATNNQGFIPVLFNMIKALFNVLILIAAMAGVIVLYRRIKSKTPSAPKPKKQKEQATESSEPTTVSEAVSSFVRHKIKRTS